MSANAFAYLVDQVLRNAHANVLDPGASGTIVLGNKGIGLCQVVTAAAESRALEAATNYEPGHLLAVFFKTDGGDLSITGAESTVVLDAAGTFVVFMVGISGSTQVWRTIAQSGLATLAAGSKTLQLPIDDDWRVWDALVTNLAGADGTDDLGLVTGTYLTTGPSFNVTIATPSSLPYYARRMIHVPANYKAGTDLTLRITATETVAATTANLDAFLVRQAAPTVDLVATAAQSIIGAAATVKSFTITGTDIVPGEVLDLRILITLNDGSATPNYSINKVDLVYTAG